MSVKRKKKPATRQAKKHAPAREFRVVTCDLSRAKLQERAEGDDDAANMLVGYAAVFFDPENADTEYRIWDDYVEHIAPGAFTEVLASGAGITLDCRGLFNHDSDNILGRVPKTLRLVQDDVGLRYEIDLPDTQLGRDLPVSVERGDITGSSFSFYVAKSTLVEEGDVLIRTIDTIAELFDVGPVTFPAYTGTDTSMRSDDTSRAIEERTAWEAEREEANRSEDPDPPEDTKENDDPPPVKRNDAARLDMDLRHMDIQIIMDA